MLGTKIPELMEFPSNITFKVVGVKADHLEEETREIFKSHGIEHFSISHKLSENHKYLSLSVNFNVESPEQMESLYVALAKIEGVKMVI